MVSFDALHTQKETIKIIVEKKGDYVGALKGNQGILSTEAEACFTTEIKAKIKSERKDYYKSSEKAHSQLEIRRFYMVKSKHRFNGIEEWRNLRHFICYEKYIYNIITGVEKTEIRYYITSLRDVELCAESIRGHWSVENKLHWHLDYSFDEDDNTTMDKNAFNNFSIINKMVLSLLKLAQPLMKSRSIRGIKKGFSWGIEESLSLILNTFDENTLKNTLENAQNPKK